MSRSRILPEMLTDGDNDDDWDGWHGSEQERESAELRYSRQRMVRRLKVEEKELIAAGFLKVLRR